MPYQGTLNECKEAPYQEFAWNIWKLPDQGISSKIYTKYLKSPLSGDLINNLKATNKAGLRVYEKI